MKVFNNNKINSKVLFVLPSDTVGGAESILKTLAQAYSHNHDVLVFLMSTKSGNYWDSLPQKITVIKTVGKNDKLGLFYFLKFIILNKSISFSRVFTSHILTTCIVSWLRFFKVLYAKNHIARESTSAFSRFKGLKLSLIRLLYNVGYHNLDLLICQTDYMKEQLIKGMPKLAIRFPIEVISNPYNRNLFVDKRNEMDHFIVLPNVKYIVSAGRLIYEKGFDLLIHAFSRLEFRDRYRILIFGDGPEKEKLISLINDLGIARYVSLPGKIDNLLPTFKKADICVISSRIEGFPNVLLEMMSVNNKIVCTECAGGIKNIKGLILSKADNIEELKQALIFADLIEDSELEETQKFFESELAKRDITLFINKIESFLDK